MDADYKTQNLHKALLLSVLLGIYIPVAPTHCNWECQENAIAIYFESKIKKVKGHLDRILHYLKKSSTKIEEYFYNARRFY